MHTLVVYRGNWQVCRHKETKASLTHEDLAQLTKLGLNLTMVEGGERFEGILVGRDADEPVHFIRADGSIEPHAIWNYNKWHYEGTAIFNIGN